MIQLNDFKRQWAQIGPAAMAAVERVGASGRYIIGQEVETFECKLAEFWGMSHAVGVANGMDALELGLRVLDLEPGEKVLTTPFSAFASTLAILRAGGIPVFVDVDDNGNIDLEQAREALTRDQSIRFFLPVHLYGNPLDLEKLQALKADFELCLVEDCAQAIGATFDQRHVGAIGQVAATSFYPTKNLGALGDGGAVFTSNDDLARRARALRNYGQSSSYVHDHLGLNSRLDELHAAVLADALLCHLAEWTDKRASIAATYSSELSSREVRALAPSPASTPVWHLFPIFVAPANRELVREKLLAQQITTGIHYPTIIPDQPAMRLTRFEVFIEPMNARRLAASEISLPIHPFLSPKEVQRVTEAVDEAVNGNASSHQRIAYVG